MTKRPTILLTGASGVVGRALIDELGADCEVICLQHRTPVSDPRVGIVSGTLVSPTLGLSRRELAHLAARVDVVVHAAANTRWRSTAQDIRAVNTGGTRSLLTFARRAEAPLYYVSTAYLTLPTDDQDRYPGIGAYVSSKAEAEQLTRDSDVPTVILRPSVVIGDSRDGSMAGFQGLHRVTGMIATGRLPMIACDQHALVDTVPQDVVAAACRNLIRDGVQQGEYWLTAGEEALTAGDLVDVALELGRRAGLDPHSPRFVPAEAVDRLILPLLEGIITPDLRRTFSELLELTWLFQRPVAMPTSLPALGLADAASRPRLREAFTRSMDYWGVQQGLLPPGERAGRELQEVAS